MTHAVRFLGRILVKHAPLGVLSPVLDIHGIRANELELAEAVVAIVRPSGGVNDEVLAGLRVNELFWSFVG